MSVKRRDKKKRILHNGESQRKDGRYAYKYTDVNGKVRFLYSWKLEPTDKIPSGKRDDLSLREKEEKIQSDLYDGIDTYGGDITVLELAKRYTLQKTGVRHTTQACYRVVLNFLKKDIFGCKKIKNIKTSDAKIWFINLSKTKSYSSIVAIRNVLRSSFQMAVEDDLIRKNPFDFKLSGVIKNDTTPRVPLTQEQEQKFLNFVKNDNLYYKYYEGIYILFKTGLRISELCGLTLSNVDMKERTITIDHQLQKIKGGIYSIETPKSKAGIRVLPMTDDVYKCFEAVISKRKRPKIEPMIDGYTGFLFLDALNHPTIALHWETHFQDICSKYNATHEEQMPKVTPHICRHTYCSNMAKSGISPKVLQYLMGHSDISVTLNVYTHLNFNDAKEELEKLQDKSKIVSFM